MVDKLEAMSTLLAVVESGSLSAASRRLGIPLATISRRLSDLERHLKTRLLQRSSRRVTLTDAGIVYIQACRRILEQIDEAEYLASGEYQSPKGELTITAPMLLGRRHVVPIAIAFVQTYPEVSLRLRLTDSIINLHEEHIDLAIRVGALPDSSLVARQIGTVRHVVCASPDYLAGRAGPATPQDLAAFDCVCFTGFMNANTWEFSINAKIVPVMVRSRLILDVTEAVLDAGLVGAGIIRLFSYHVADAVRDGKLKLLLSAFEPAPLPVNVVYPGGGLLPLKVRAFIDFAAPQLQAKLALDLG
jgi:DNA-binding transcriptional LysR family regulator